MKFRSWFSRWQNRRRIRSKILRELTELGAEINKLPAEHDAKTIKRKVATVARCVCRAVVRLVCRILHIDERPEVAP